MTDSPAEALRLIFVIRPQEVLRAAEVVYQWQRAFDSWPTEQVPRVCVWVTGQNLSEIDGSDMFSSEVCVHALELDPGIDHYPRSAVEKKPWSPWGLKSGPNAQFFEILRRTHQLHDTDWVLQLETDTVPVRAIEPSDIKLIVGDARYWVAGASAHYAKKKSLSASTADHINGAAFYRAGSAEFIRFLTLVWARSLLQIVTLRPAIAYDALTSPGIWSELSKDLADSWRENEQRFVRVPGMVNLSNQTLRATHPSGQLEETGIFPHASSDVWFLHVAKNATPDFTLRVPAE